MTNNGPEFNVEKSPLRKLNNDLRLQSRAYADVYGYYDDYIVNQFNVPSDSSARVMEDIAVSGLLPSALEYDLDPDSAITKLRLSLYSYVLPLAESYMDEKQLADYLPNVMAVAYDKSGVHQPIRCRLAIGADSRTCAHGICPVSVISEDLRDKILYTDFSTFEYQFDPLKTKKDAIRRLHAATRVDIFPSMYSAQLEIDYNDRFEEVFHSVL